MCEIPVDCFQIFLRLFKMGSSNFVHLEWAPWLFFRHWWNKKSWKGIFSGNLQQNIVFVILWYILFLSNFICTSHRSNPYHFGVRFCHNSRDTSIPCQGPFNLSLDDVHTTIVFFWSNSNSSHLHLGVHLVLMSWNERLKIQGYV